MHRQNKMEQQQQHGAPHGALTCLTASVGFMVEYRAETKNAFYQQRLKDLYTQKLFERVKAASGTCCSIPLLRTSIRSSSTKHIQSNH